MQMNPGSPFKPVDKARLERRLLDLVDQYRSIIIDPVEQELGSSKNWPYIRSRLLKALGDRGLACRISEILNSELGVGGGTP